MKFNNTENSRAANAGLGAAARICFGLSMLSSSVAVWSGVMSFVESKSADAAASFWVAAAAFIAVGYVCYMIDFFGISKTGKFLFTEVAGLACGSFDKFATLRKIAIGFWALIFAGFFFFSFATSYYGSDLVKAFTTPKIDTRGIAQIGEKRAAAEREIIAPLTVRREKLEAAMQAEIKGAGNAELVRLAKSGNGWAEGELAAARAKIEKKYASKFAELDKQLAADKASFSKRQDAIDEAQLVAEKSKIDGQNAQANAVGLITLAGGVAPLVIGVLIIGVMAVGEVAEKSERAENNANANRGGGQTPRDKAGRDRDNDFFNLGNRNF